MLDQLETKDGATRVRKRVGRGRGSGHGKTSGTGFKGQGTRSGKKIKAWFEGGQMPLQIRLPKRGFFNRFRTKVEVVNVSDLVKLGDGATVDAQALFAAGLIRGTRDALVKVLGDGEAPKNLTVKVDRISASAKAKIEAAGGSVELLA
ncbi:MAG TPA: 50S ribosomal protein L15 [Myxococcales bacterium]|nr:50S ribosomal protein L15 [Myxococcales bacterium]HIM01886.1 50S ribosomal protein L15 [Myxococcales bacterium]